MAFSSDEGLAPPIWVKFIDLSLVKSRFKVSALLWFLGAVVGLYRFFWFVRVLSLSVSYSSSMVMTSLLFLILSMFLFC